MTEIEAENNYMEDSLWEVEHFLAQENIDKDLLNETMIDDMAYHKCHWDGPFVSVPLFHV